MGKELVAKVKWEEDFRDGRGAIVIRINEEVSTAYFECNGRVSMELFMELRKLFEWGYKIEWE